MFSYYPIPYPNEVFYSLNARFKHQMQISESRLLVKTLFGTITIGAIVDFPTHLEHFIEQMPLGYPIKAKEIIHKHSLLPFYAPFLAKEKAEEMESSMLGKPEGGIYPRQTKLSHPVPLGLAMKFCPICSHEDKKSFGEVFWHREHQLPIVEVCYLHNVWLESIEVFTPRRVGANRYLFTVAEELIPTQVNPRSLNLNIETHQILHFISKNASWLLEQSTLFSSLEELKNRYIKLLRERQYANTNVIRFQKLLADFEKKTTESVK